MKSTFLLSLISILVLSSCTEKTQVNLVNGTLFQDCDDRLSGFEIALKTNETGSFNNQIILGAGISNADGGFNFTYELDEEDEGTADIILVKSTGFETLVEGVTLNQNYSASIYRNDISTVEITLGGSRVYSSTDTLFYGISENLIDYFKIQPSAGILDTLQTNLATKNQLNVAAQLYYGVGKIDFEKARTDTSFNNVSLKLNGCQSNGSATIVIN